MELNKAVLDCMQALRRKLRAEQALDIRLSQPDAISAMLSACLSSSSEETRELGQRLAQFSDMPFQSPVTIAPIIEVAHTVAHSGSVRIYRGQRVYA